MSKFFFPHSFIPEKLQLGRKKLECFIKFGLTPNYKVKIFCLSLPETCIVPKFVSRFDEAFIRTSKREQMNVHVMFFDDTKQKVFPSYILGSISCGMH